MKSNLASTLRLLLLLTFVAVLLPLSYGLAHRYTFFVSRATGQNTYYVSLSGADSNPGAIDSPWRHLTYAASKLQPGDLLYIRGGNYNEPLTVTQSGTALAPITIAGYPGENVVIDPAYTNTAGGWYGVLVQIGSYDSTTNTSNGNYVTLQDLEIRNSYGMGLAVIGSHGHIINVYSHHHMENGILIMGDYGIVENSTVSFNCQSNINGSRTRDGYWASGLTAARDPTDSLSDHVILRHNKVFENWGEGLSSYEADSITMEDNVVYNNFSANIYISDTTNTTVQRNLVYETSTASVNTGSRVGIMMGDEKQKPASRNNTIINNLVYGSYRNYYWWGQFTNDGLVNDVIANNTFVNSLDVAGVQINNGNGTGHVNTIFQNNIIIQENTLPSGFILATSGITFGHNAWSKAPNGGTGAGDVTGTISLARSGSTASGQLTGDWFRPLAGSIIIDKAQALSQVPVDYFSYNRGSLPDIGGVEYVSAVLSTPTPTPTVVVLPTLTSTPIPTSTPTPTLAPTMTPQPTATLIPTQTPVPTSVLVGAPQPTATPTLAPRRKRSPKPTIAKTTTTSPMIAPSTTTTTNTITSTTTSSIFDLSAITQWLVDSVTQLLH